MIAASDAWLVTGIPGAGKSTVSKALAARMPRGVHIEGDRLQEWIVSGAVWPGDDPREESERQVHLNIHNQGLLARSYAEAGFVPVLDYIVISTGRIDQYQQELDGLDLHFVVLKPGREVALERDSARAEKTVGDRWAHFEDVMVERLGDMGFWIDTRAMTVDETVDAILAHRDEAELS